MDTATTITELGAAIVASLTKNPKALSITNEVVQLEPAVDAAVQTFIALFKSHQAAKTAAPPAA